MTKEELKDYLTEEAEYDPQDVDNMDDTELLDAYLTWNGIIGYTDDIIDVIKALSL